MKLQKLITIVLLFVLFCAQGQAQLFDTLLTDFYRIHDIHPLEDGTSIIVGYKDGVVIQRINSLAQPIWHKFYGNENIDVVKSALHLSSADSSLQLALFEDIYCDISGPGPVTILTMDLNGHVYDSIYMPILNDSRSIYLFSGDKEAAMWGIIRDTTVLIGFYGGDSLSFSLSFTDTTFNHIIGFPTMMAVCPFGKVMIGSTSGYYFIYEIDRIGSELVDIDFGSLNRKSLECFAEHYVATSSNRIEAYADGYVFKTIQKEGTFFTDPSWKNGLMYVWAFQLDSAPYLMILDSFLNEVYIASDNEIARKAYSYALRDDILYSGGLGISYNDGGNLWGIHTITKEGNKIDDLELVDFDLPKHDTYYQDSLHFHAVLYHFPNIDVEIRNNGDYPIEYVTLISDRSDFCGIIWSWERKVRIDLNPGETKTYSVEDYSWPNQYPYHYPIYPGLGLIRGDNRADDNPSDNFFGKKIDLVEIYPWEENERVRIFPNPVVDNLYFLLNNRELASASIYDTAGRKLLQQDIDSTSTHIDLATLHQGLYTIQFIFKDGDSHSELIFKSE